MKTNLNINESFICRIWEGQQKYFTNLLTTAGEPVEIISIGKKNYDGGPDYTDAKIKIGAKTYTGDVEIHRDFSGWEEHGHSKDRKYLSVILQVVLWDSDERTPPALRKKRDVPTVILSNYLNHSIHNIWQDIIDNPEGRIILPCLDNSSSISDEEIIKMLNKLSTDRLNLKSKRIKQRLAELGKELLGSAKPAEFMRKSVLWEQAFYEFIFEALGFSKNKEPMLKLAKSLKLGKIRSAVNKSNETDSLTVQSLLYGCGGFLFDLRFKDSYITIVKELWNKFKDNLKAEHLLKTEWQFFRLRPQNFPTVRLAYGSQLILRMLNENLFKNIVLEFRKENFDEQDCYISLTKMFEPADDAYWSRNYNFGKSRKSETRLAGKQRISDIIVNVVLPFVFLYSNVFEKQIVKRNVISFYNEHRFKPDNSVIKLIEEQVLKNRSIKINTPAFEQGAIQLYNFYCTRNRCSDCKIGERMLKKSGYEYTIIFY